MEIGIFYVLNYFKIIEIYCGSFFYIYCNKGILNFVLLRVYLDIMVY